jgi:hypothetical protein
MLFPSAVIITAGLLFIVAAVLMQEVRSRLVHLLIQQKSPLGTELSDWSVSGGRIPGHYGAIKSEFIWGLGAAALLQHSGTKPLLQAARVLYVVREIGRYCGLAGLVWLLWCAFGST